MTRLYYFVEDLWALDDVQKQRMKVSRFGDLNDPYELYGLRLKNFPDFEQAWLDVYHQQIGLLCFSKIFSDPIMWSHYANKHKGVCFGFDLSNDIWLNEVKYVSAPEIIEYSEEQARKLWIYRRDTTDEQIRAWLRPLIERALTHKHEAWKYEREVRILVNLMDEENGMYFKSMCEEGMFLKEVILGVRSTLDPTLIQSALKTFRQEVSLFRAQLSREHYEVKKEIVCNHES